jgi:alpha-L-fucosidase
MDKYTISVGRNSNMLLGIVADRRGLVPDADVKRLDEFGLAIKNILAIHWLSFLNQCKLIQLTCLI